MTRPRKGEEMPFVKKGMLHRPDSAPICAVAGGKTGWLDWLKTHTGFRYESLAGVEISVIKERRKGRTGEYFEYWYGHRHVLGQLRRIYIGKAETLTIAALENAAGRLAQLELGQSGGGGPKMGRSVVRQAALVSEGSVNSQGHVNENAPGGSNREAREESVTQQKLF